MKAVGVVGQVTQFVNVGLVKDLARSTHTLFRICRGMAQATALGVVMRIFDTKEGLQHRPQRAGKPSGPRSSAMG